MSTAVAQQSGDENPLVEGLERLPVHPTALVIFGATGDLAHRKLLPALYNLAHEGALPERFELIGVSRRDRPDADFRADARASIEKFSRRKPDPNVLEALLANARYVPGSFDDDAVYSELDQTLSEFDQQAGHPLDRVFYLSTAPEFFPVIAGKLGAAGLTDTEKAQVRIVIEKPFGYDLASARQLNVEVLDEFDETQVFRIDHYLGKETVQNIYAFRFANAIFEPIWSNSYVDHVQITVAESLGVEHRAAFYEETGVVRDIVQNHLLQVMALVAMEPPAAFEAESVRDEKAKALRATRPMVFSDAVRGQYGNGYVAGEEVLDYHQEPNVPADSNTPTYIAAKLEIDNWRWAGTPFYIRTGKRLAKRVTEVAVQFKRPPHLPFSREAAEHLEANSLVLRIQPDEGISLRFGAKAPTPTLSIRSVNMDFQYGSSFLADVPEAYETLLLDAIRGDSTLFTRQDSVERSWQICDPLIEQWRTGQPQAYASGSWGPDAADELLARDGRRWRRP